MKRDWRRMGWRGLGRESGGKVGEEVSEFIEKYFGLNGTNARVYGKKP